MYNFIRRLQTQTWVLLPRPLVAEWNLAELNGPWAGGVYNDISILHQSNFLSRMFASCYVGGVLYHTFGDSGYANHPCLIVPHPKRAIMPRAEKDFNRTMSKIRRIAVEWAFGHIRHLFPLIDYDHALRLGSMPAGGLYLTAALITNCHVCLYGSHTTNRSSIFRVVSSALLLNLRLICHNSSRLILFNSRRLLLFHLIY